MFTLLVIVLICARLPENFNIKNVKLFTDLIRYVFCSVPKFVWFYPSKAYICNYAALLDYLIDTDKDVDLLIQKKIIVNDIGSN